MAILAPADDRETLVVGGDSNEQGSEQDSVPGIDHGTHGSSSKRFTANPLSPFPMSTPTLHDVFYRFFPVFLTLPL